MENHNIWMKRCLQLAALGRGKVSPNPMVGSVLVYNEQIIGEGFHEKYGNNHAEVNCIQSVPREFISLIEKSTLYVSLEPCSHQGKTPPCVHLIIRQKIKKVVIACRDFSEKVNGKGIEILKSNGVEVIEGVLEQEAIKLNRRFFVFETLKRPYIILKWAESQDRYISKKAEQNKISNTFVDRIVHTWRTEEDAIMIGFQTAIIDNPRLNVRLAEGKNPIRIVYDKEKNLPLHLNLFNDDSNTIIFNHQESEIEKNNEWIYIERENYLQNSLSILHQKKIQSIIVEGGAQLINKFIQENLWDEARIITGNITLQNGVSSPQLNNAELIQQTSMLDNELKIFKNKTYSLN